ncbi:MAG TPA: marine proteobacterial sortase target protein [Thermoanaerobaculia bacterium]
MGRNLKRLLGWVLALVVLAMVAGAAAGQEGEGWSGAVPLADVEWVGLVWSAGERGVVPAVLLDAEVEIAVGGMVARSRVRQTFVNQGEEWAEGVYVFPLPENAAIDRLRMVVGERVIEGQVREKEEARREFEAARREGRRASLLEQHRPNVFTTRVTNVAPGEAVEVTIELQQAIDYDAGRMRLRFPTVVAPRYFPAPPAAGPDEGGGSAPEVPMAARAGDPEAARQRAAARPAVDRRSAGATPVELQRPAPRTAADATAAASLSAGCCAADEDGALRSLADAAAAVAGRAGRALQTIAEELRPEPPPPNRLALAVRLDPGFPLAALGSPSHAIDVTAAGARGWRVALAEHGEAADRDFELVWEPAPGQAPRAALFTDDHQGDTYALLVVLPPEPESPGWAPLAREVVFVLDTSGSMAGVAIEQARAALGAALGRLEPWDLFNVIEFDDRARPLFPASVPADPAAVERARAWVAGLAADGGTEMRQALALALPGAEAGAYRRRDSDRVRQVVFLTDGAVGNEDELLAMIAARLGDARLFTVGIGSAPNGWFMRRAAEVGRGGFTWIGDLGAVGRAVDDLARKLEGPVLTDLEVTWDDPTAEVWPERLPDLYAGEPLVVAARLIRRGDEVRVSGRRGGVWWQETVRFADAGEGLPPGGDAAAPVAVPAVERGVRQLWARRKIDHWLGRLVEGMPEDEVRREVVEVALAHHLVSRWTSLVAVDVTPVRPAGEALTAAAVPLALPEGHLPMGGTSARWDLVVGVAMMLLALPLLVGGRRRDRLGEAVEGGGGGGEAMAAMTAESVRQEVAVGDGVRGEPVRALAGPAGRQAARSG